MRRKLRPECSSDWSGNNRSSTDAVLAASLSEQHGIFLFNKAQRIALRIDLTLRLTGFGTSWFVLIVAPWSKRNIVLLPTQSTCSDENWFLCFPSCLFLCFLRVSPLSKNVFLGSIQDGYVKSNKSNRFGVAFHLACQLIESYDEATYKDMFGAVSSQ